MINFILFFNINLTNNHSKLINFFSHCINLKSIIYLFFINYIHAMYYNFFQSMTSLLLKSLKMTIPPVYYCSVQYLKTLFLKDLPSIIINRSL